MLNCDWIVRSCNIVAISLLILTTGCHQTTRFRIFTDPSLVPLADSMSVQIQAAFPNQYSIEILERSTPVLLSRIALGDQPDVLLFDAQDNLTLGELPANAEIRIMGSDTACLCSLPSTGDNAIIGIPPTDLVVGILSRTQWEKVPESERLVADFYPQLSQYLLYGWVSGAWMWTGTCRELGGNIDSVGQVPAPSVHRMALFTSDPQIRKVIQP